MPAVIASDLIKSSLRLIGAIATGETPSADELTDALGVLNDLVESWSAQQLTLFATTDQVFTVTAGKASYSIGPGGDWAGFRPVDIASAFMRYGGIDYELSQIEGERYNQIALKAASAPVAQWLHYSPDFPLGTVILWPVPSVSGAQVTLSCNTPLSTITNPAQTINLPPGYSRALRYALAIELAPEFGVQAPADVVKTAAAAMSAVKRANKRTPVLTCDDALTGGGGGGLANFMGGF